MQALRIPVVRGHNAGTSKSKEFTGLRCQTRTWTIGLHAPKTRVTTENILQKQRMPRKSDSPQSLLGIVSARQYSCTFLAQSAASCVLCRHAENDTSDGYSDCKGSIISIPGHRATACISGMHRRRAVWDNTSELLVPPDKTWGRKEGLTGRRPRGQSSKSRFQGL